MNKVQDDQFTGTTAIIDTNSPAVVEFARLHADGLATDIERAVALYYAVRDEIRYDPYRIDLTVEGMKATTTLSNKHGWCVPKAVLLAACCRSLGIPARLGFADVRNHLSTERMRERMRTDIFYWHGYTEILLEGRWVKATPAFNVELCDRFGLLPLEFDGLSDSLYHPFDREGNRHMEYVNHRGTYSDLPLEEIIETFRREYSFLGGDSDFKRASFDEDVKRETS